MLTGSLVRVAVAGTKHVITIGQASTRLTFQFRGFYGQLQREAVQHAWVASLPTPPCRWAHGRYALAQGKGPQHAVFGIQHAVTALGQLSPFGMLATGRARGWQTHFGPVCTFATRNVKDTGQRYRGVTSRAKAGKWRAVIGMNLHVGCYDDSRTAARQRDVAIDYLVQKGMLAQRYLDSKNVSLGNLRKFKPTAADLDWVEEWWVKKTTKKKTSAYRGVYYHPKCLEKPWLASYKEGYRVHHLGYHASEVEAALVRDNLVRALEIPKRKKLLRLNFFLPSDYLNREEAEKDGCIGVYSWKHNSHLRKRPYIVQRSIRTDSARCSKYLGYFASVIEAAQAYDRDALAVWAQQNEPRGPLPPTNFCPTEYRDEIPLPPTIYNPTRTTTTEFVIDTPPNFTHTTTNRHVQPHSPHAAHDKGDADI